MDNQVCHFEGHLNSPITDDEVRFILKYDIFYCSRHTRLKELLNTRFQNIRAYSDYDGCCWALLEETVAVSRFVVPLVEPEFSLRVLYEAAS